jgi:hypothetical protein
MKKPKICFLFLVTSGLLVGIWFFGANRQSQHINRSTQPLLSSNLSKNIYSNASAQMDSIPTVVNSTVVHYATSGGDRVAHLYKSTNYPPTTPEEKAMWNWWQTMEKVDPDFQWKMPIAFYGKVVDQFDAPVVGAEAVLNWTTVIGPVPDPKKSIYSDASGQFSITNIQGKGISIAVYKRGYDRTRDSFQDFEYASFYEENFHVPDPSHPVLFHLHKTLESEPLYKYPILKMFPFGGSSLILNVEKGTFSSSGDLAFSAFLNTSNQYNPDFTIFIRGLNGASLIPSSEEFLSMAPETGYQDTISIRHRQDASNSNPVQQIRFYVKTRTGKYAAFYVEIDPVSNLSEANIIGVSYYNPSGSRNLEFDQDKWINR